jgi:hypothetical protein
MKKITIGLGPIFLITLLFAVFSCQKDRDVINTGNPEQAIAANLPGQVDQGPVTRAYRDSFDVDLQFKPDIAGGWSYLKDPDAPVWFPGDGFGNATHMGNANIYFNTYTIRNAAGTVMVYGRPVNQFYAKELQAFNIPPDVHSVVYDDKGNSIWGKIAPEGMTSWHIDATHVAMTGKNLIVGGTGKFAGATGETTLYAAFNQLNLKEALVMQKGRISY